MAKVTVTATRDFKDRVNSIIRVKGQTFELPEDQAKGFGDAVTIVKKKKPQDITMDRIQENSEKAASSLHAKEKASSKPERKALKTSSGQPAKKKGGK